MCYGVGIWKCVCAKIMSALLHEGTQHFLSTLFVSWGFEPSQLCQNRIEKRFKNKQKVFLNFFIISNQTNQRQDANFRGNHLFQSYEQYKNKQSLRENWKQMTPNEAGRQRGERRSPWQQAKHAKLYSDLLRAKKREPLAATDFPQWGPSCLRRSYRRRGCAMNYSEN